MDPLGFGSKGPRPKWRVRSPRLRATECPEIYNEFKFSCIHTFKKMSWKSCEPFMVVCNTIHVFGQDSVAEILPWKVVLGQVSVGGL